MTRNYISQLRNPPITILQWLVPTTVVVILIVIVNVAFFMKAKTETKQTEWSWARFRVLATLFQAISFLP